MQGNKYRFINFKIKSDLYFVSFKKTLFGAFLFLDIKVGYFGLLAPYFDLS